MDQNDKNKHEDYLQQTIELALYSIAQGGGPFGAIIVKSGAIVARGYNQVTKKLDPTAHAEIIAIRSACKKLGVYNLQGCQIYSSCEPCPMCTCASYWARVDQIWYAATCQDAQAAGFDDVLFSQEIALPACKRQIPSNCIPCQCATTPFDAWLAHHKRKPY